MLKPVIFAGLGSALLLGSAPALAQLPQIRHGEPVGGTLSSTDSRTGDDAFADVYLYRGKRGERLTISLGSEDFDAYLFFAKVTEDFTSVGEMQGDDDGGGDSDALLEVLLEEDGYYAILASSYAPGQTGAYRLSVLSDQLGETDGGSSGGSTLFVGGNVRGSLGPGDELLDDGTYYDYYSFHGRAGQQVDIVLRSGDFDAYLSVGRLAGGTSTFIDSDDDGAGGTDSRLRLTIEADGEYWIRANTLGEGQTGAYSLSVTEVESRPALAPAESLAAGGLRRGELGPPDSRLPDGTYYDEYVYQGRAGERLTISLESRDFATFLMIGRDVNGEWEYLTGSDDEDRLWEYLDAYHLNSHVEYTLPQDGEYLIRATAFESGETGRYVLRVRSSR